MSDRGATDAHEVNIRDEGIVEEFEADRAESALLLLEDAVGDCVEEENSSAYSLQQSRQSY